MSKLIENAKKLLFNEKYADMFFVWDDGNKIPTHRNIVLTAAPYFE